MICSTENRFLFTTKPPSFRLDFAAELSSQLVQVYRGPSVALASLCVDHTIRESEYPRVRTTLLKFGKAIDRRLANEQAAASKNTTSMPVPWRRGSTTRGGGRTVTKPFWIR